MNDERLLKVVIGPHITEKSSLLADSQNCIVFKVIVDAKKSEVAKAVEKLFDVKVKKVRVINVKGKKRVYRQQRGKCKSWKKAYVTLHDGHDITFAGA